MADITFLYGEKRYSIVLSNGNLKCSVDGRDNLSLDEKKVFLSVVNSLKINISLSNYIGNYYLDESFNLYYDYSKDLYFTDSLDSSIIKYVNNTFNNMSSLVFDNDVTSYDNCITRFIKVGERYIKVVVLSSLSLLLIAGCSSINSEEVNAMEYMVPQEPVVLEEVEKQVNPVFFASEQEEQPYDFSMIEEAINTNEKIGDKEKEFIKNFKFLFDEFHKYMDIEMCTERLSSLDIVYDSSSRDDGATGCYNIDDNVITLYKSSSFDDCSLQTFIHEVLHVFQRIGSNKFFELSNEALSREIMRKFYEDGIISEDRVAKGYKNNILVFGNGYSYMMPIYYALAETVSKESLIKYQFLCDTNILVKDLISSSDGEELSSDDAFQFFSNYSVAASHFNDKVMFDMSDEMKSALNECLNNLNYYYSKKKEKDIKSDFNVGVNFFNSNAFNPYGVDELDIVSEIMVDELSDEQREENEKRYGWSLFGFYRYVLPRDYFLNKHDKVFVIFNSPTDAVVEINDDIKERFYNGYISLSNNLDNKSV